MQSYQYIGTEYTMIRLVDGEEKQKVVQGEIIETDRFTEKQMLRSGFQVINDENPAQEFEGQEVKPLTKPQCVEILDKAVENEVIESYDKRLNVAGLRELVANLPEEETEEDDSDEDEGQEETEDNQ